MFGMNSGALHKHNDPYPLHSATLGKGGPAIVMLHGWGRNLETLRPLGELLAKDYSVTLLDLPGFGRSPLPPEASNDGGGWGTLEYMRRVKEWLDQHNITQCVLIGHSFGGRISVQLAAHHPELVRGVVLIGAHGLKRERSRAEELKVRSIRFLVAAAKRIDSITGSRIFAHYFAPRFGSTDYKNAGELRKTLVKTVNEDLSQEASKITAPTLLLWGENDREAPLDIARNYRKLISDSELHIFPRKGHEPFADVGGHLVARYTERFLQERGIRGA
jgi:pimeloyl-ACP methyl ester carboxylesterase